jgi:hypothetical protein
MQAVEEAVQAPPTRGWRAQAAFSRLHPLLLLLLLQSTRAV